MDLLEYGFPLDFDRDASLLSTEENHASAKNFLCDVQTYISDELKHGAILPKANQSLQSKPIGLHVSPFMTRNLTPMLGVPLSALAGQNPIRLMLGLPEMNTWVRNFCCIIHQSMIL